MKKLKTSLLALSCLFLMSGALAACTNNSSTTPNEPINSNTTPTDPTPSVSEGGAPSLTIKNGDSANLIVGQTLKLDVESKNLDDSVSYSSSAPDVASVDDAGLIKAVKAGKATITASAGTVSDVIEIIVVEANIPVTSIQLADREIEMDTDDEPVQIVASVLPEQATDKTLTWKSNDEKVATVDQTGKVTPVGIGTTTITITSVSNPSVTASCTVKVLEAQDIIEFGKFGLYQPKLNKSQYFSGSMVNNYYFGTTENYGEGVDVYAIDAGNDQIYLRIGEYGQYIGAAKSGSHNNIVMQDAAYAWDYDETYDAYCTTLGEDELVVGSYNSYDTISLTYADNLQTGKAFPAHVVQSEITKPSAATSIYLSAPEDSIDINEKLYLEATLLPAGADGDITYEITAGDEYADINGNELTGVAAGKVTVVAKSGNLTSNEITITVTSNTHVTDVLTIAEAKEMKVGSTITVRGEVTAVSGKSAYIADETGGFYIYNWYFNNEDTAIVNKEWVLGMDVEVHATIAEFSNLIQLSNYEDGRIDGTYAIEIDEDITPMTPIELTEEGYADLKAIDAGNLYTFYAEYVSGTPSKGNNVETKWKLGNTEITLRTDKNDTVEIDETFVKGDIYKITTPLSWYESNPRFAFLGTGTILEKQDATASLESLSLSASADEVDIGETITLTATKTPAWAGGDVSYAITEGNEFASLDGNVLTGRAAGTVKVQASVGDIKSNEVTITVTDKQYVADYSIGQITEAGKTYTVRGEVVAENTGAILISDGTDSLYIFSNEMPGKFEIGDYVEATGAVESFNKAFQMSYKDTNLTVEKLSETPDFTIPDPTPLTAEIANGWKSASAFSTKDIKEYTWTAVAGKSGNNTTLNIEESDINIEPVYLNTEKWNITENKVYSVTAYFIGYYSYASIVLTGLEEQPAYPLSSITITAESNKTTLAPEETVQLTAAPNPGAVLDSVTWSSDNSEVATVSDQGLVTAVNFGTAKITATSGEISGSITITVAAPATYNELASYDFRNNGGKASEIDKAKLLDLFNKVDSDGIVDSISEASKVYSSFNNYENLGLKFGTGSGSGGFTALLSQSVDRVVVTAVGWTASDTLTINGQQPTEGILPSPYTSAAPAELTFDFSESTSSLDFLFSNRGYISSIVLYAKAA